LPRKWTKEVGLEPGDTVFFEREEGNSLKLRTRDPLLNKAETEEFVINTELCKDPGMLERVIIGNYIIGRDTLRLVSSRRIGSEHIEETRRITRKLIGMSIVEAIPDHIILQCSIDPAKFKLDMLIRRLSILALTMVDEAIKAVVDLNPILAKDVINREEEANAMFWLTTRLINSAQRVRTVAEKIGIDEPLDIPDDRLISKSLEKIADWAENIARRAILLEDYKDRILEETEKLSFFGKLARDTFQKSMECIFSGDIKNASSTLEMKKTIEEEEERLMAELGPIPHLRSIALGFTRIVENSATIAAIAINRALEKPSDLCEPY